MKRDFIAGDACTINGSGDLMMLHEARPFIGRECVVVKLTKSGLVQVALRAEPKMRYSFPQRNVDLKPNDQAQGRPE